MDQDHSPSPSAQGSAYPPRRNLLWGLLVCGLFGWQAWLTLTLFGQDSWERLLNDQPILSGRHPLHLYHGFLGAQALRSSGSLCCYDPFFQAGYPKTPVFDGGSRPAEFFLALTGGTYRPVVYKVGLALCFLAIPWLLLTGARSAGFGRAVSFLATTLGLLVWWSAPGRQALEAGDLDLHLAALAALAQAGLLVRFDRAPGFAAWLGILAAGCLGWFAHPLYFALTLPLVLIYYLSVGARHRLAAWHLALWTALLGGLAVNLFWLTDWVAYWWIRSPLSGGEGILRHRTLQTVWDATLWGEPVDRALAATLFASALAGVWWLNQNHQRPAARILGLSAAGLWLLCVLGITWEPLGRVGTEQLLVPALWCTALPAAQAGVQGFRLLGRWVGGPGRAVAICCLAALTGVLLAPNDARTLLKRCRGTTPLEVGLGAEREALIETLKGRTSAEARILWEDRAGPRTTSRWTALLPLLSGRSFLGGLDVEGGIEHSYARLAEQKLAGRHLSEWSDAALDDFCWRYNVGWVVCWSPAAVARFNAWPGASLTAQVHDEGTGYLFTVLRQPRSFALKGQAQLVHADCHHITLADVIPEDGAVVLSLHYQKGLRASPSRVQVEPYEDTKDPIRFIRLRVSGPVARVILTWEDR
jgi:hypothetical protein